MAMEMHKDIYETIEFFKHRPSDFLAWCVPMLKEMSFAEDEYIYSEGESVNYLYFIENGRSGFVLPRFDNAIYIVIE
jgi:CRP-like cAMP-binding protein